MKHLNIKVIGRVQGVFFRHSARMKAQELGIFGFASNEAGGSVYIEAEGEDEDLEKFLDWCRQGTNSAEVKDVELREGSVENFKDFSIK